MATKQAIRRVCKHLVKRVAVLKARAPMSVGFDLKRQDRLEK